MLDKKALALRVIALEGVVDYCDRLVICSAGASRQVAAIADHIHGVVKKELARERRETNRSERGGEQEEVSGSESDYHRKQLAMEPHS